MATTPRRAAGARARRRRQAPPGSAPGTLIADPDAPRPVIRIASYGPAEVVEETVADLERVLALRGQRPVMWVNVDGLGDVATVARLGEIFGLHRLALEDVMNVNQRAKVETYPGQLYMVARMLNLNRRVDTEQLSLFLGQDFVLTFQERPGDNFDPVRERIRGGRGRMRHAGPGYLAYALLDAVVDQYFPLLEAFGERLEALEAETIERATQGTLGEIHATKRDLLTLRRSIWPLREMLGSLLRDPNPFIQGEDRLYMQDVYDHAIRVMDLVEAYREVGSSLMDVYLSSVNNKLNEVMKVLTIFASIFIPLTFIAGIYGMNFDHARSPWNLPELEWYWGYPFALGLMALVAGALVFYFRRKGWLGGEQRAARKPRSPGAHGGHDDAPR